MLSGIPLAIAASATVFVVLGGATSPPETATSPLESSTSLPETGQGGAVHSEWREVFAPDGTITRVHLTHRVPDAPAPRAAAAAAEVVPIEVNGPSLSRFDLVFVGDGYTSGELGVFSRHARSKFEEIMSVEPFRSRRKQFNAWQVNVVSAQSGVDNDPTRGVLRNTALDMYFWCGGTERLLCANTTKAKQYAAAAGDVDHVIALANTTKYGGGGGTIATSSGGNARSGQIAVHELGHSIGGLADEYDYNRGDCYPGGEPREANVSVRTADQMQRDRVKWYRWIGQVSPDGGTVGSYTGARYYKRCIYRPTQNSIMRTLGREFNLPGREAMIAAFDRETGVVEAAAAPDSDWPWVRPVDDRFTVTWRVDGRPVASGRSLDIAALGLARGEHTVTAIVTDPDASVRLEPLRATDMSQTMTWRITR